ncbi:DUF2442 domain-containing protein [Actinoplanes palleronii]|uniref:DUF2442 domain-containing protein n=1 Tax=Actinoplanes palleronii TaxID=113570 RepID=UPI0019418F88|nr:DUF2442 domain-containing protein [Actinoplanes palleronii]
MPRLLRVVPTETWQLVLEFDSGAVRLFDCSAGWRDRPGFDGARLTSPETFKHLTFSGDGIRWPGGPALDADYLFTGSREVSGSELERQQLRVAYRNQAPTPEHPTHHVYFVYVAPFAARPLVIGESINGGHAEMGGSAAVDLAGLLARPGWQRHFELAGCAWAVPLVEDAGRADRARIDDLVREVCRRADTAESDVAGYHGKH